MNTREKLLKMADVIQEYGFYPHDLYDQQTGAICFIEARYKAGLEYEYTLTEILATYTPMSIHGEVSALVWAMNHNLTTEEAVEFIRKVAERL